MQSYFTFWSHTLHSLVLLALYSLEVSLAVKGNLSLSVCFRDGELEDSARPSEFALFLFQRSVQARDEFEEAPAEALLFGLSL